MALATGAGVLLGAWTFELHSPPAVDLSPGRYLVEGRVRNNRCGNQHCAGVLDVSRARPLSGTEGGARSSFSAWIGTDHAWVPGERIRLVATLGPAARFRNPGTLALFDFRAAVTGWAVSSSAIQVLERAPLRRPLEQARAHVRASLVRHTAPAPAAIGRALVLGEPGALDNAQRDAIRAAGLAHLVAVSGLHMALLAGIWQRLATWLARQTRLIARWPAERIGAACGLCMLPLAVTFAGAAPSAQRAGLTAGLGWLATLLGRRPDPIAVASVAVILCLGVAPDLARSVGFLLSVSATASLVQPATSELSALSWSGWRSAMRASVRSWVATLPLALGAFGFSSPWGLLTNLVAVPFATVVWVPLALVHALACSAWGPLAGVTAPPFEWACHAVVWLCARLPALVPGGGPLRLAPLSVCGLLIACVSLLWGTRRRAAWSVAGACVLGAVTWQCLVHRGPGPGEVEVTFLDVGQGDAAVVRTGDGKTALIDAGGRLHGAGPDPGARSVLPWLRAHGVDTLELVVLSHPHPDHYGGLQAVVEHLHVEEIWDTGQARDEDARGPVAQLLRRVARAGARVREPGELCGTTHTLGASARWRVLAPCPRHDPGYGPNDNSFVLELSVGQRRLLFPGDAERAQETKLVRAGTLRRVDVLKVGHHGSRTSSHAHWLKALKPSVAVISCGRHNLFGHPHPQAIGRLSAHVPHVLRIDQLGGVQVWTDGRRMRVVDARDGVVMQQ